jgi:hypothetical protein
VVGREEGGVSESSRSQHEEHVWNPGSGAPTLRERHLLFDLTHCAFTMVDGELLYRCTLWPKGHQGDHHRIEDSHMQPMDATWGAYLDFKEAFLVDDEGRWL